MKDGRTLAGWGPALLLAGAVLLARVVFLVWLCPFELVADEAYYWDWSRHLSASYSSKGPGVAFTIALATALLGTSEASVRLPAALAGAVTTLAAAALAGEVARRDGPEEGGEARAARARFLGAALVSLVPLFQGTSLLMTIDGPYLACWAVSALCAFRLRERLARGVPGGLLWPLLGLLLGLGFLYKYTLLLLPAGLVLLFVSDRPATGVRGPLAAAAAFLAVASPVLAWNAAHGWPTTAHLLGRAGLPGGDAPPVPWRFTPRWALELLGAQLALLGPAAGLVVIAIASTVRGRRAPSPSWPAQAFAVACAAPVLLFHGALALVDKVEGTWPAAAYATLLPLAAARIAALPAEGVRGGERRLLRATLAFGLVTGLGVLLLVPLASLPGVSRLVPLGRLTGARDRAAAVARVLDAAGLLSRPPLIVTPHYAAAAQLAFYLPGRPEVSCASRLLGDRPSAYDFLDVSLGRPENRGRPVVLVGAPEAAWRASFSFPCGAPRSLAGGVVLAPCLGEPRVRGRS